MTREEYVEAYMKGVLEAWKMARKHPDLLDNDFLTVRSADEIADEVRDQIPEGKKATILMKFPEGEYKYGTYDFNTPLERAYVNELAMRIKSERFCETEVREE